MVLIAACAGISPVETLTDTRWAARQAKLSAINDWTLSGRIGVIENQKGWHASLYWNQQGQAYSIELIGPLGQGRLRIRGNEREVTVRTADGQVLSAPRPEQLLEETVGFRIPVDGLVYWIRGLPDPSQRRLLKGDQQGRLLRLEQNGWVIEYPRYMQVADLELPAQIRARRGDVQLKLVIKKWDLPPHALATVLSFE